MNIAPYAKVLDRNCPEEIVNLFHDTLVTTNRNHEFFVDWAKVKKNVERYRVELSILSTLIGSKNFDDDLRNLLLRYPQVVEAIPLLIAVREKELSVIDERGAEENEIIEYDFSRKELEEKEIEKIINFFHKTGLKTFLQEIAKQCLWDYVTGVEVGMDTNARKNRSGSFMERAVEPILYSVCREEEDCFVLRQKYFSYLRNYGIEIDSTLANRKADFLLMKGGKVLADIEVNFYAGTGSKPQEIVDAYINRQEELRNNGIAFVWITDGYGWRGQKNQIRKGFEKVDYVLNLYFVKKGVLREVLWTILNG